MNIAPPTFKVFAVSILLVLGTETVVAVVGPRLISDTLLRVGVLRFLEISILLWIAGGRSFLVFKTIQIPSLLRKMRSAVVICLMMVMMTLLLNYTGVGLPPFFVKTGQPPKTVTAGLLIVFCLLSPLAEELFFRGVVYRFFRQFNFFAALLISSCLFATFHSADWTFPLLPLAGGVLTALVYERDRVLISPVLVHMTGNALLLFMMNS